MNKVTYKIMRRVGETDIWFPKATGFSSLVEAVKELKVIISLPHDNDFVVVETQITSYSLADCGIILDKNTGANVS